MEHSCRTSHSGKSSCELPRGIVLFGSGFLGIPGCRNKNTWIGLPGTPLENSTYLQICNLVRHILRSLKYVSIFIGPLVATFLMFSCMFDPGPV